MPLAYVEDRCARESEEPGLVVDSSRYVSNNHRHGRKPIAAGESGTRWAKAASPNLRQLTLSTAVYCMVQISLRRDSAPAS